MRVKGEVERLTDFAPLCDGEIGKKRLEARPEVVVGDVCGRELAVELVVWWWWWGWWWERGVSFFCWLSLSKVPAVIVLRGKESNFEGEKRHRLFLAVYFFFLLSRTSCGSKPMCAIAEKAERRETKKKRGRELGEDLKRSSGDLARFGGFFSLPLSLSSSVSPISKNSHRVVHRLEQRVSPLSLRVRGEELLLL